MQVRKLLIFLSMLLSPVWLHAESIPDTEEITKLLTHTEQLITEQHYQEAADILERVLMLAPDTQGAADAYQQVLQLMALQQSGHQLSLDPPPTWNTLAILGAKIGGGNNLNRGPTYQQGILELAKNQQPQSGYGLETYGNFQANTQLGKATRLNIHAQFQQRSTNRHNFTDYIGLNGGFNLQHALRNQDEIGLALYGDFIRYDNGSQFYAIDVQSRYRWRRSNICQPQIGVDLQWQHQLNNNTFDQLYTGLHTSLHCQFSTGLYSLELGTGNAWALHDNPGGNQTRLNTQLTHNIQNSWVIDNANINSYLRFDYQQGQTGYSPILNNNAIRNLHRLSLGAQYRWPISQRYGYWSGVLSISWQRQYSNIQLFEFNSLESWVGVEVIW
ncbi:MAG: hypothetical protein methR_PLP0025 (plasmid) [Methyloprofundus sp.]|nr:MAG: hypothetical protein methR_PLP0025 [Methyloprofundus sp.]